MGGVPIPGSQSYFLLNFHGKSYFLLNRHRHPLLWQMGHHQLFSFHPNSSCGLYRSSHIRFYTVFYGIYLVAMMGCSFMLGLYIDISITG